MPQERMGRKVEGPGRGKQHQAYLKWKEKYPEKYEEAKNAKRKWLKETKATKPWWKHYVSAVHRCRDKKHWYFKKGIKCYLTIKDVEFLWFRDKAHNMKEPTLDRIKSAYGYIASNTRFSERLANQRRRKNNHDLEVYGLFLSGKTKESIQEITGFCAETVDIYIRQVRDYGRSNPKSWNQGKHE